MHCLPNNNLKGNDEGFWSPWEDSSPCTVTCGKGSKERLRECIGGGSQGCEGGGERQKKTALCINRADCDEVGMTS